MVRLAVGLVVLLVGAICDRRRPRRSRGMRLPTSRRAVILLAVAVGAVEVATMLPYVAAIEAVAESGRGWAISVLLLAAYVLITLVPALLLLVIRVNAAQSVSTLLRPLMHRVERMGGDVAGTVLLVVGALLAADAAIELNVV
ncbi:MAG: GAP family protein [Rhodococcus sp. (in: high G+C Gram-positive bacteria)]